MLKRMLSRLAIVVLLSGFAAPAFATSLKPINGRQAPAVIKRAMKARVDATGKWRARLGGKSGQLIRPFEANNIRPMTTNASGHTVNVGKRVTGTIYMRGGMVHIDQISVPRGKP